MTKDKNKKSDLSKSLLITFKHCSHLEPKINGLNLCFYLYNVRSFNSYVNKCNYYNVIDYRINSIFSYNFTFNSKHYGRTYLFNYAYKFTR